jgi:hypothetical protein
MSVSSELYKVNVVGDGSTPSIAFNRKVFNSTDIKGFKYDTTTNVETALVNGTDFTVTGAGDTSSGVTITPSASIPTGTNWVLYSDAGNAQSTTLTTAGEFPAKSLEYAFDKLAIGTQEADGKADRALKLPMSDTASTDLPNKTDRASKVLGFDASGNPTAYAQGTSSNADAITYDQGDTGSSATTVEAKLQESISVKDFGAVGDNTTDDTTAFQEAIDALPTRGGSILVPEGGYIVAGASLNEGTRVINWIMDKSSVNERVGTAQAGATTSITLDAGASASNDFYNGLWIRITGGTGSGQATVINDYNGTTKVATVEGEGSGRVWQTTPDATSVFEIDADLPGVRLIVGEYDLPETTFQANRNVYVQDHRKIGETSADANATTRQYAIHIDGFMSEDAAQTTERELRALSFDLGTDVDNLDGEIRGIKGRVYATGGSSNLRAIYGFADAKAASGFTGVLTGMLATVYKNGNSASESVGIRAHMDDGCTAGVQVAGAGVAATDEMSYAYMARTGSGQPCLASVAYFMAHGGNGTEGQGDFLLLYESATSLSRSAAPFIVNYKGQTLSKSLYSGSISSLADDAATSITPPAGTSGILKVWVATASGFFAEVYYRVSGTPLTEEGYKGANTELTTGALTGTTGTDTKLTVSSHSDGSVYIENRTGASRSIGYCWFTTF